MATPSLAMIPSAYADSKVYSVLPNNGDGDFTFNRDSSATRVGQNGLIQEVGYFGNNLVTNGDFSNGSTDWGLGSNWSVANGKASCDGSASNSMSQASTVGIASTTFKVSYDVLSISQGSIRITLGGVAGSSVSQVGSYSDFITATSTDRLRIFADSSAIASIDNIIVQEVTGDQPRLNYDISNGVVQSCPSLLLEPASTNSVEYSEDLSNSYWSLSNASISASLQTSPDGSNNARKVDFSVTSSTARIVKSTISANKKSLSFFFKYASLDQLMIYIRGIDKGSYLDVKNALFLGGNAVGGGIDANNVSIENYGNGWYRFIYSHATSDVDGIEIYAAENQIYSPVTLTGSVLLWGFQLEDLSYATSYIPTNGASQTRAAETCGDAGTVSTFNSTEGVLYFESSALALAGGDSRISLSDGTLNNRISFAYSPTASKGYIIVKINGVSVINNLNVEIGNHLDTKKIAISYKSGDTKVFLNGVELSIASSVSFSGGALNDLSFESANSSVKFYGNCKDIRVYNEALTDLQLQKLTTL